ncbi:MAG: nucleotidyltransferase domain-containing protein [Clostridia bacterium]|nr:nucleotidyltransferase domain-containing protein [Clostridia bacterium]
MIDIHKYIHHLTGLLSAEFGQRLLYVGLQGSYLRGEANENSDADIMVIIDNLTVCDLDAYRAAIASMDHFDKSCGFICSRADLAGWNPLEIAHLLGSTKDYHGTLGDFVPAYTREDVRNFVRLSLNNLYHEICHRYIHADRERNEAALPGTYKGVFFILQNLYLLRNARFVLTKDELLPLLEGKDYAVMERGMALAKGGEYDFDESFALLFSWCQETLASVSA